MKKVKWIPCTVLVCCLLVEMLPTFTYATQTDWRKAYFQFIEEDTAHDLHLRNNAEYQLIYIDDDEIPELWINYGTTAAGGKICTFDGNEVIYKDIGGYEEFFYVEKESIFYTSYDRQGFYTDIVHELRNHAFSEIAWGSIEVLSWEPYSAKYDWNAQEVSEDLYNAALGDAFPFSKAVNINFENPWTHVDICVYLNQVQSISFNKSSLNLKVGETDYLELAESVEPYAVTFVSNNPSVAKVDEATGEVTAVSTGTAVISVTIYDGITANCIVAVEEEPPSSLSSKDESLLGNSILFSDLSTSVYYYDAVQWAVKQGITSGTSNTTFSPDAFCTRAQAVTFLWRAAGSPKPNSTKNPFTDINAGTYYYDAVLWAVEQGITSGTTSTTFNPNAVCDRSQIVAFLYRANGSPNTNGSTFFDVPNNSYYSSAVKWAVAKGITSGTSSTTFNPNANCTRGQIVTFLYRVAN